MGRTGRTRRDGIDRQTVDRYCFLLSCCQSFGSMLSRVVRKRIPQTATPNGRRCSPRGETLRQHATRIQKERPGAGLFVCASVLYIFLLFVPSLFSFIRLFFRVSSISYYVLYLLFPVFFLFFFCSKASRCWSCCSAFFTAAAVKMMRVAQETFFFFFWLL